VQLSVVYKRSFIVFSNRVIRGTVWLMRYNLEKIFLQDMCKGSVLVGDHREDFSFRYKSISDGRR
jgi:hypothetical protein